MQALQAVDASNVWMSGWISDQQNGSVWHRPYSGNCDNWGYYPYRLEYQTGYSNMFAIDAADANNAWAIYALDWDVYPWQDVTESLDTSANVICGTITRSNLSQYTEFALAAPLISRHPAVDFDGDAKPDITVWRPATGVWFVLPSATPGTYSSATWGTGTDLPDTSVTGILSER
jgi:hypothetical protein